MRLQAIRVYFTGKLQVAHVNCVWGLFACSPQVKSLACEGNFARVSLRLRCLLLKNLLDKLVNPSSENFGSWEKEKHMLK